MICRVPNVKAQMREVQYTRGWRNGRITPSGYVPHVTYESVRIIADERNTINSITNRHRIPTNISFIGGRYDGY
jgi:hypothetical protein